VAQTTRNLLNPFDRTRDEHQAIIGHLPVGVPMWDALAALAGAYAASVAEVHRRLPTATRLWSR
jgi:hypothetical protein